MTHAVLYGYLVGWIVMSTGLALTAARAASHIELPTTWFEPAVGDLCDLAEERDDRHLGRTGAMSSADD